VSTAAADGQRTHRGGGTALARCAALPADVFADEHWGRRPLLSRAAELGSDFADLLSPAAVDELVSERGLRTPFLRMAKEGVVQPASSYTRGGGAGASIADQAADDKVLAALADGSTLVLQGLHRAWPPLVDLGTRLAAELGHPVQINAYITPPQNQGFAPHYDVHDVFVLQVAGRKHWVVHDPVVQDPLDSQPFGRHTAAIEARVQEPASIDTVLAPGDALYLPRGAVHSAQALGELSIHLTVGVHPLTRHGLVRFLLEAVQDDPELRASLPMGVDLGDPEVLEPLLDDTVAALSRALAGVPARRIAERVTTNLAQRTRPAPLGPLAQLTVIAALTPETPVRLREALRARVAAEPGAADLDLVLLDRTVKLPAQAADALALALEGETVTAASLPGLPAGEALTLVRRLMREGVLVPA
jgi:bifunctional lysine-specific demethylase and histidyl-hydroxylase NO66